MLLLLLACVALAAYAVYLVVLRWRRVRRANATYLRPRWTCDYSGGSSNVIYGKNVVAALNMIKNDPATSGATVHVLRKGTSTTVPNDPDAEYVWVDESGTVGACYKGKTVPSHRTDGVVKSYANIGRDFDGTL